jgi:predicted nucleic acid-binding protein
MARYRLDTNHLSYLLDDESTLRQRIYEALRSGHRLGTCVPVLCELEAGIAQTRRREHNQRILSMLLRRIRIWPLEVEISPLYAEIYHDLRSRGRALSQVDMLLAAMARALRATLLTSDRDFASVPTLRVENWLI